MILFSSQSSGLPRQGMRHAALVAGLVAGLCAVPGLGLAQTAAQEATPSLRAEALRLLRADRPRAALALLAPAAASAPGDAGLQLDLAVLAFRAGDPEQVRQRLGAIDPQRLSPRQRRLAATLARQSQPPARWRFDGDLGLQPASNPGRKTSARRVTLFGGDFTLNPDARAAPETGLSAQASATYLHPLRRDLDWQSDLSGRGLLFSDPTLNEGRLIARTGPVWRADRSARLHAYARIDARFRGGDPAHEALGLGLSAQRRLAPRSLGFATLGLDRYDVARSTARDGDQMALVAGVAHSLTARVRITPSLAVVRYRAQAAEHSYWDIEGRAQAEVQLDRHRRFEGRAALGWAQHDGASGLDGQLRTDRRASLTLRLSDSRLTLGPFLPVLEVGYEKTRSTSTLSSYENLRGGVGLEWRRGR